MKKLKVKDLLIHKVNRKKFKKIIIKIQISNKMKILCKYKILKIKIINKNKIRMKKKLNLKKMIILISLMLT